MSDRREPSQGVQRARVGMIGLAVVVLLIGIASAIMRTASHEAPVAASGVPRADLATNLAAARGQDVGEPLAEMGVAPAAGNQAAPAHVAR